MAHNVDYSIAQLEFQHSLTNSSAFPVNPYLDLSRTACVGQDGGVAARPSSCIVLRIPFKLLKLREVPKDRRPYLLTYEFDIVISEQAERAQGLVPSNRGLMEYIYELDPHVSPEPNVSSREGGQTPYRDSKKRLSRSFCQEGYQVDRW
ncbi:hypothetical protein LWI28_021255 [Acer negundo]|uniref:Uncharacterized protein n=1 Tax=Acer negundo TaxID=4023 RepID=A0AAD5IR41_ACENE|nr:hypothetical protein LWI28_021255 [Acer negundo]